MEELIREGFFSDHGTTKTHMSQLTGIGSKILSNQGHPNEETLKKIDAMKRVIDRYDIFWPSVPPAFKDRNAYDLAVGGRDQIDAFFVKKFNEELSGAAEIESEEAEDLDISDFGSDDVPKGWSMVEPTDEPSKSADDILSELRSARKKRKTVGEWFKSVFSK